MANNSTKDFLATVALGTLAVVIAAFGDSSEIDGITKEEEEKNKAKANETFEKLAESKVLNRGSVIAVASENGWTSYDIGETVKVITTPERAEAAIGLIKAGYNGYEVRKIVNDL